MMTTAMAMVQNNTNGNDGAVANNTDNSTMEIRPTEMITIDPEIEHPKLPLELAKIKNLVPAPVGGISDKCGVYCCIIAAVQIIFALNDFMTKLDMIQKTNSKRAKKQTTSKITDTDRDFMFNVKGLGYLNTRTANQQGQRNLTIWSNIYSHFPMLDLSKVNKRMQVMHLILSLNFFSMNSEEFPHLDNKSFVFRK